MTANRGLGPEGRSLPALVQDLLQARLGIFAGLLPPQLLLDARQPLGPPTEDVPLQG